MLENKLPVLTRLLKHRFLQIVFFGLVLGGAATLLIRVAPSKAQELQPKNVSHLSLLVERGFALPPQSLTRLKSDGVADATTSDNATRFMLAESIELPQQFSKSRGLGVTFTISGDARFENKSAQGLMVVTATENWIIKTPTIRAGPDFGESFIQALIDGQPIIEQLRVATLEVGGIENLKRFFSGPDDPAILVLGDHYAVIDESQMRVTEEAVELNGAEPSVTSGLGKAGKPESIHPNADAENLAAGLCIRTPFGPGKVKWTWSTPWSSGYSVKPESSGSLVRASAPDDSIDAIYRRSWGCGTALKVPNSCTLTWNSNGSWSSCCNAAAAALGHVPQWVNPRNHGFPNCPL